MDHLLEEQARPIAVPPTGSGGGSLAEGVAQRILVRARPGVRLSAVLAEVMAERSSDCGAVALLPLAPRFGIERVEVGARAGVSAPELAAALAAREGVEYAHMDRLVDTQHGHSRALRSGGARLFAPAVNDPAWPAQWDKRAIGLTPRPDSEALEPSGVNSSGAFPGAWARQRDATNITVCIVDTGLDVSHPDLAANLWVNAGEIPGNGIDDDKNGVVDDVNGFNGVNGSGNITDADGHGTHCAGSVGAVANNALGVAGVAGRVRLLGCKAIAGLDGHLVTSAAVRCLEYCASAGAHITSNSWGGQGSDPQDDALRTAIRAVQDIGQLFVTAAGNYGSNSDVVKDTPTNFGLDIMVSVAASDLQDAIPTYSNYGAGRVHLAAPGSEILSTVPNARYYVLSGTSMAAPQVAGAAALLLAAYAAGGANVTGRGLEVKALLLATVQPVPGMAHKVASGGRLDVGRAMAALPADLSVFKGNPNAPLPYDASRAAGALGFNPAVDPAVIDYQPTNPGEEIASLATWAAPEPLLAGANVWFHDRGRLSDYQARYDCLCSSCLGPERVYTFTIPVNNRQGRKWWALEVDAMPHSSLVVSVFRHGQTGDPGVQLNAGRTRGAAEYRLPQGQYMVGAVCGGVRRAVVQTPVEVGVQYYVIVDGMSGYAGDFNVTFSARPLDTPLDWQGISSPGGLVVSGNLAADGGPLFKCVDRCPSIGCQDTPSVVLSFTPDADATLQLEAGPYDAANRIGVVPSAGDICLVQGTGAMVGPCALLGQPDAASCGALRDAMPRFPGMSNTTFVQLNVTAGKTFFVLLSGSAYVDSYSVRLGTVPLLARNPALNEVRFDSIQRAPTPAPAGAIPAAASPSAQLGDAVSGNAWASGGGFGGGGGRTLGGGFTDSGLLSGGRQEYDCPCAPGACQGPEVLYSFRAAQQGFVKVTTQPYYAAEDIGINGQASCAQGGCFFGVMHYIYKDLGNSTSQLVACGLKGQAVTQRPGFKQLTTRLPVDVAARYYVVVDSAKGAGVGTEHYYGDGYTISMAFEGVAAPRESQAAPSGGL
ncbi:hypothetical protein WJX81_002431 [Elliptochloris bilobata]|uniref:Peptidase S8/S53 domain-containing protein n=1 Tax=Elliptochloris bilobata TaxID=381761 RepID=A0AAW1SKI2_9CHLO